jgi:hypothetical protein
MNTSIPLILIHESHFTNLPLAFLFIYNLTMPQKFNNMQFKSLNMLPNFMKVLYIIRKHPTKNEYISKHIPSTTIYLGQEQKLNNRNYSEQEMNMGNFV